MVGRRYRLFPQALERIQATMERRQLRPVNPRRTPSLAARRYNRYYMAPVHDRRHVVWFKAGLENAPGLDRSLREEISIQRVFAAYERLHQPRFDSPSFLASGGRGRWRWLLRKYWTGAFAGDMVTHFGLSPSFCRRIRPEIMAGVVRDIRAMTPFVSARITLPIHDVGWYRLDFNYYQREFWQPFLRHPLNTAWRPADVRRLESHFRRAKVFLRHRATAFTHGDLYPNNIMVQSGRRKIVLFDWELSHRNLPTFDAVMVWLMAWQQPTWRQVFRDACLRSLGRSADTDRAWNLAQLSLTIRLAGFCFIRLAGRQPERYPPLPSRFRPVLKKMLAAMLHRLAVADQSLRPWL
ncbi:MAG: phosphotransferase [Candidatus Kerfeldbacteria bacterium]|nr:phosphotransferase [Candidatus Kerfeldbacteria bacterium]